MKSFDPYAVLGVGRDAGAETVKQAERNACKEHHPDVGDGNVDAFQKARRAAVILLDPAQRKKFDDTGSVDDDAPDNTRAGALQVIESFFAQVLGDYINSGFADHKDPRTRDLIAEFKTKMDKEIAVVDGQFGSMKKAIDLLADMLSRFKGKDPSNPIERGLQIRMDSVEASIRFGHQAIALRKLALEIVESYTFRADPKPETDSNTDEFRILTTLTAWPR